MQTRTGGAGAEMGLGALHMPWSSLFHLQDRRQDSGLELYKTDLFTNLEPISAEGWPKHRPQLPRPNISTETFTTGDKALLWVQ